MRRKNAIAVVLCLMSTMTVPTPAGASVRPGFPVGAPLTSSAGRFADALTDLDVAGEYEGVVTAMRVREDASRVLVHTKDVPRAEKAIAVARERSPGGVTVEVRQSRYSRHELEAARDVLWEESKTWTTSGAELYSVALHPEGDGLIATVDEPAKALAATADEQAIGAMDKTDVDFRSGERAAKTTRYFDTAPFAGGVALSRNADGGHWCTSAFAIRQGDAEFLMTAEHCYQVGAPVHQGGGHHLGNVVSVHPNYDAASIRTDTWSGVYILNEDIWNNYRSAQWTRNGMNVCQSGYTSNQICDLTVTDDNATWNYGDGIIRHGAIACRPSGPGSRGGDSGGPVYSFRSDGLLDSRGIVSGNSGSCLHFTQTKNLLTAWNVELITS